MNPDQTKRLTDLQDRLVETAINDADPKNWTANGMLLSKMSATDRGDAAWCRKTAVQTVSLLIRVTQLLDTKPAGKGDAPADVGLSEEDKIKAAERAARALMDRHAKQS